MTERDVGNGVPRLIGKNLHSSSLAALGMTGLGSGMAGIGMAAA